MSDQPAPTTYVIPTVIIALAISVAMILFLRHQWG